MGYVENQHDSESASENRNQQVGDNAVLANENVKWVQLPIRQIRMEGTRQILHLPLQEDVEDESNRGQKDA